MKCFIVLFAIVAAVSAGYHHAPQVIHVAGNPPIPDLKAAPYVPHGNDHTTRIHYSGGNAGGYGGSGGHPHLVAVEQYHDAPHYEPSVTNIALHGGYGGHGGHGYGH
ncbi:PREDICTED: splicing factor 1-like [Dinoponera quadriceps]|uniref:Splicing factor 1-like n=1 Tax=Dinoponera quadriceps TaxID=609295 RepID=A0A6P3WNG8_DINQU|nr:PREDICTED: splicing factor 1-like [Dinoponera quadriceps]